MDAYNAQVVIQLLHSLAIENSRTIIMTIHQPRREIIALFDKIMIQVRGELLYYGNVKDGVEYFEENGYAVPSTTNPVDHFLVCGKPIVIISCARICHTQYYEYLRMIRIWPHLIPLQNGT